MSMLKAQFEATNGQLPDILGWIEEKTMELLPFSLAMKLQLAAEEAIVNVVRYAYAEDAAERPLLLSFGNTDDIIYLEITDYGKPFNPLENIKADPTAALEERELGGWGRSLMVQMTSAVSYVYRDAANVLRLEEDPSKAEQPELPE